jgi:hypothetical protein
MLKKFGLSSKIVKAIPNPNEIVTGEKFKVEEEFRIP